jgi:hypothetical protein
MGLFDKKLQVPVTFGKTADEKKVIKYFTATNSGCLSGAMKDEAYDKMVMDKLNGFNAYQRALEKIGLDEDELKEIPPVSFHGYEEGTYSKVGKDGRNRTSKYSTTWLLFSSTEVYMYYLEFNMDSGEKMERTEEYFYEDITSFSTQNTTREYIVLKPSCLNKAGANKKYRETSRFALIVPGDAFYCATSGSANVNQTISAVKQKLREKKNEQKN